MYYRPKSNTLWVKIQKGNGIFGLLCSFATEEIVLLVLKRLFWPLQNELYWHILISQRLCWACRQMETAWTELNWTITQLHGQVGELRELGNSVTWCYFMNVTVNSPYKSYPAGCIRRQFLEVLFCRLPCKMTVSDKLLLCPERFFAAFWILVFHSSALSCTRTYI